MSPLAIGLVTTLLTTTLLLWLVERYAPGLGLMDIPNDRSSHTRPTPRGGGIAIVMGSGAGLLVALVMEESSLPPAAVAMLAAAGLVAGISLLDDLRPLAPVVRLGTHVVAALVVVGQLELPGEVDLPGTGTIPIRPVALAMTVVWIVGVTNIYNFMDGIDGLAAGQGVVAGATWGVAGLATGDQFMAAAGLAIAASCAIFLARNWAPARIFMGDAGSAFLGFSFASLPLLAAGGPLGRRAWPIGAVVLLPFLFDATLTLLRRLRRGENVLQPHRTHLYQRLVVAGAGHAWVSGVYIGLAAASALVGLAWGLGQWSGGFVICVVAGVATTLLLVVRRREM